MSNTAYVYLNIYSVKPAISTIHPQSFMFDLRRVIALYILLLYILEFFSDRILHLYKQSKKKPSRDSYVLQTVTSPSTKRCPTYRALKL